MLARAWAFVRTDLLVSDPRSGERGYECAINFLAIPEQPENDVLAE
jgi:hypothetical protein